MEKEQFDLLVKQVGEQAALKIKEEVGNATKGLISEEKLNDTLAKHNVKAEDIQIEGKSLVEILKEQGAELTATKALVNQPSAKAVSLATAIVDGYKSMLKEGKLTNLKKGQWESIEIKSAATMSTSNIDAVGTSSIPYNLATYESGITGFVRRSPFIAQLMNSGNINKPYVQWTEMVNADGGAAMTAEGGAKSQYDYDLQESSKQVRKITAYTKVTKEMLDDTSFIEAEIRSELIAIIALKLDEQLLSGNDSGENLKGVLSYATAFSAGNFAAAVDKPTWSDVLAVATQQVETALFQPNYIVMHPEDVTKLQMEKDTTGQPVYPMYANLPMTIKGVPIVSNTGVTAGTYLVGDFTKANLRIREGITVNIGLDSDDFTKNLVTILAEMRAVHYVKAQHTTAFVYGTFATDVETIRKSS